jgi:5-methyltetrahydrofolate corrinoid/iron sulfur protein methyltransferase
MHIIGDLINNAYARARKAFQERNIEGYQRLALLQAELGVEYLDLNLDGTPQIQVRPSEMLEFIPRVIPAIQQVTQIPLCIDNPSFDYQRAALEHYDRDRSGPPIVNSLAASRERLDDMIALVSEYDTLVIVMVSERFVGDESAQSLNPHHAHEAAKRFVERLSREAGRRNDQIFIDPGLAPVGADTYGLVNIGLDAMRLIRQDPDLNGVHFSVGLSNFAWGTPKHIRHELEKAYLTIASEAGLDFAIANPETSPSPLPGDHPVVRGLREALDQGRVREGETAEAAGFRQAEAVLKIWEEEES